MWDWFHFPRTKRYWCNDLLYKNEHFSSTLSREWFESILRFFNFGVEPMFDNDRLSKIRMIIEHLKKTMLELIVPEKNLSIDESMMLLRGRLIFDSTSKINVINMESSFVSFVPTMDWFCQQRYMVVKASMTLTTQVKLYLSYWSWWNPIWRKDTTHSLITVTIQFRWRNSCPQKELIGILRKGRKRNPKKVISTKLKKEQMVWKSKRDMTVAKW